MPGSLAEIFACSGQNGSTCSDCSDCRWPSCPRWLTAFSPLLVSSNYFTEVYLETAKTMRLIFRKVSSRASYVDIMTQKDSDGQVGNSSRRATGYILSALVSSQRLPEMANDRTGRVRYVCSRLLCQSIAIDGRLLCGYRLIIDWPILIDTN